MKVKIKQKIKLRGKFVIILANRNILLPSVIEMQNDIRLIESGRSNLSLKKGR